MVCYVVGLQTILVGTIEKERPSGRTISIGADTLDLEEISARRAEIDEASGHGLKKFCSEGPKIFLDIYPCYKIIKNILS